LKIFSNVAKVGKYSLKVLNSLVHGGPYVAIHVGKERVAWFSFKTKECEAYEGVDKKHLDSLDDVVVWFRNKNNYNIAATKWNDFKNGVNVPLFGE
jgi:hypothetical protein